MRSACGAPDGPPLSRPRWAAQPRARSQSGSQTLPGRREAPGAGLPQAWAPPSGGFQRTQGPEAVPPRGRGAPKLQPCGARATAADPGRAARAAGGPSAQHTMTSAGTSSGGASGHQPLGGGERQEGRPAVGVGGRAHEPGRAAPRTSHETADPRGTAPRPLAQRLPAPLRASGKLEAGSCDRAGVHQVPGPPGPRAEEGQNAPPARRAAAMRRARHSGRSRPRSPLRKRSQRSAHHDECWDRFRAGVRAFRKKCGPSACHGAAACGAPSRGTRGAMTKKSIARAHPLGARAARHQSGTHEGSARSCALGRLMPPLGRPLPLCFGCPLPVPCLHVGRFGGKNSGRGRLPGYQEMASRTEAIVCAPLARVTVSCTCSSAASEAS